MIQPCNSHVWQSFFLLQEFIPSWWSCSEMAWRYSSKPSIKSHWSFVYRYCKYKMLHTFLYQLKRQLLYFQIQLLYDINFLFLSFKVLQHFIIWHNSFICRTQQYSSVNSVCMVNNRKSNIDVWRHYGSIILIHFFLFFFFLCWGIP